MIGLSMAMTIAVCVIGFTVVYSALDRYTGDFIGRDEPTLAPTAVPTTPPQQQSQQQVAANGGDNQQATDPTVPPANDQPTAAPTASPSAFTPDYQVGSTGSVNLRSGPGTEFDAVSTVPYQAPLQYLNETKTSDSPDANTEWMKFRTEDGDEGWIRKIDVDTYQP